MVTEVQKATVPLCCCLSESSPAVMGSKGDPHHVCAPVAVVRCSFWIYLSLQIMDVACSGHPTPAGINVLCQTIPLHLAVLL